MYKNYAYCSFVGAIEGKKLVCFGTGVSFSQFSSVYTGKIDLLIDDNAEVIGRRISTQRENLIVKRMEMILSYPPDEAVVLVLREDFNDIIKKIHGFGYYKTFIWKFIRDFESSVYDDMSKYMIEKEIDRIRNKGFKIAHIAWHNGLNAGDHVLCHCVREVFKHIYGDVVFSLIHIHDVVNEETICELNKFDLVVIGGGGLFLPNTNENNLSGWQWACPNNLLEMIEVPLIIFSVGYNYFYGQKPNKIFEEGVRRLEKKTDFLGLRNKGSLNELRGLIGNSHKIIYQPCVTTCIKKYKNLSGSYESNNIAINIALDYPEMRFGDREAYILAEIARVCKTISRTWNIYVTIHCYDDWKIMNVLYEFGVYDFEIVDMIRMHPDDVINYYAKMEMVITSRGHGQMIPFGIGIPVVSLNSHPKMKFFIDDIGDIFDSRMWYIDVMNEDNIVDRLLKSIDYFHSNRDKIEKNIENKQEEFWEITKANLDIIKRFQERGMSNDK